MESTNMNNKPQGKYDLTLSKSKSIPTATNPTFGPVDNEEYTLPRATLTQLIKEMLPAEMRMSCQSSDLIIQLSMNFLHYISDMSNNVCNVEGKKTITPSHVAKALKDLKMDSYLSKILELGLEDGGEVQLSAKETKDMISQKISGVQCGKKKKKRGGKGGTDNGMTEEEMIAEQRRLFDRAKNYDYSDGERGSDNDEQNDENESAGSNVNMNMEQYPGDQQQQQYMMQNQYDYANQQQYTLEMQQQMMYQQQQQFMQMDPQQQQLYMEQQMLYFQQQQQLMQLQGYSMPNQQSQNSQNDAKQDQQTVHNSAAGNGSSAPPTMKLGISMSAASTSNQSDNKLLQDYTMQMKKMKSQKDVDDMNFDDDEEAKE